MHFEKHTEKILIIIVIVLLSGLTIFKNLSNKENKNQIFALNSKSEKSEKTEENEDEEEDIVVYITGEVNKAGVYKVKKGQRLDDLLKMAGGPSPKANLEAINLALKLVDEMKVVIPSLDAKEQTFFSEKPIDDRIDLNLASKEELMTLDGIGEKTAQKIIAYREKNQFIKIEDITKVSGIGTKTFESIKEKIKVN